VELTSVMTWDMIIGPVFTAQYPRYEETGGMDLDMEAISRGMRTKKDMKKTKKDEEVGHEKMGVLGLS